MNKFIGKKFGRLVVIKRKEKNKQGNYCWLCQCNCNNKNEVIVSGGNLNSGHTQSCGCLNTERITKHGYCGSKIYRIWYHMKERCINPNRNEYKDYGGRGIKICERWMKFSNFLEDMGETPEGLQLDRENNNKGYYKENCRWATPEQQGRNRRNNFYVTYNGKTQLLLEWSEETGILYDTLRNRFRLGWSIEKTLTTPTGKKRKNAR